jgi:glucose/arabinose dehydrogenase
MKKFNFSRRKTYVQYAFISLICLSLYFLSGCKKDKIDDSDPLNHMLKMKGNGVGNTVTLKLVADNLVSPLGLVEAPDASGRLFIFDQAGKVYIVDSGGTQLSTPFLDLTSRLVSLSPFYDERGLIGFAFHPQFSSNGKFYVHYQSPPVLPEYNNLTVISEFTASGGSNVANMASERRILEINDPQMNHNGGTLEFGKDGYMYIAIGDGGGANDTAFGHVEDWYAFNEGGNGQDLDHNLFGGILRIDVNAVPYAIPGDNPFVGTTHKAETWAYGMRNPYRMSFDMLTGELYSMDAGQNRYEEINRVMRGGNYGWNVKEGRECFNAADALAEVTSCPSVDNLGQPLIDPVIQLNNWLNPEGGIATTIIGGNVYRGEELRSFKGKYIFGIFSHTPTTADGQLFWADPSSDDDWSYHPLNIYQHPGDIGYYLKGFGQDLSGEMYITVSSVLGPSGNTGKVYMLTRPK